MRHLFNGCISLGTRGAISKDSSITSTSTNSILISPFVSGYMASILVPLIIATQFVVFPASIVSDN